MRVSELIKIYREEEKDNVEPYFTSDFMIINYLNESLVEFAKKTLSFYDSSSEVTQLYVSKGQHILPFDRRILEVKHASIKETGESLTVISANVSNPSYYSLLANSESGEMFLNKEYQTAVNLQLRVIRKPLKRLDINDREREIPDINEEDYCVLLYYIKYRAFSVNDAEIFDQNRANTHLALFEQKCQEIREQALHRRAAIQPMMMESLWSV